MKWLFGLILFMAGVCGAQKPNVIIVLTDDQGYGDFSCHGNPILKTPNLDRLHDQSIRFTDFHAAPVCTTSRGQLLSGMDGMRNGAWSWAYGHEMIHRQHKTMAGIFRENGYATAMYGKWHLGENYPHRPQDRGFDEALSMGGGGSAHQSCDWWQSDCMDDFYRETDGVWRQHKGYATDIFFNEGIGFMKRQQAAGKPFFLYLPTTAAHGPHYVPEEYKEPYKGLQISGKHKPEKVAGFFGMIANLDENMGRLDRFLRESGLDKNTIVIFMTDNGGTAGVYVHNSGMRGNKCQFYEGGHRVPCFFRAPVGGLGAPRDIGELTQMQDILPTLIELCGLECGSRILDKMDGVSLAGLMRGGPLPDRKLCVQWSGLDAPPYGKAAVLWKKWRLVHNTELYNLADDPGQQHDVAAQYPEIVQALQDHYARWWKTTEPVTAVYSRIGLGGAENPVRLSCFDWTKKESKVNVTLQQGIWAGDNANGQWELNVEKAGRYRFELRRYPIGADFPMTGSFPETQREMRKFPACRAMPITQARMKFGGIEKTVPVKAGDKAAAIELELPAGPAALKTWLLDAAGNALSGAYYVDITRL